MTHYLQITLLNSFTVLRNGQPVHEFAADNARALLAYLALHRDRLHTREQLADLLWPEQTREANLANLRSTLHRLREALNDFDDARPIIQVTRQTIGLHAGVRLWVDSQEVKRLAAAVRTHQHYHSARCPHCAAQMQQLVDLCTGNFLAAVRSTSEEFDDWRRRQQEQLHDILQAMLHTLADFHLQRHDFVAAIACARRQLALEPWNEQAHEQLMRALLGNGQRSAALAQYKRCCTVLETEFGAKPMAATQALFAEIRAATRGQIPQLPGLHTLPLLSPLHGRQSELTWLREQLVAPNQRLVTLVGMGGVGKTHLAVAAANELRGCFADGVWFVPLAGVTASSPAGAAEAIARAIGEQLALPLVNGVSRRAQLLTALAPQNLLLVLDNFDQLLAGRQLLTELLAAAPQVTLLVTTRIHLDLGYESSYPLLGLAASDSPELPVAGFTAANTSPAAALTLFSKAAQRVQPAFTLTEHRPEVAAICQLVGGLPLALELAAAYVGRLPLTTIAARIEQNLDAFIPLTDGVLTPSRDLRVVFEASWQLLPAAAQKLFLQLAHCVGEITLTTVQALPAATPEAVDLLVRHSFLQLESTQARYHLHPLLRRFGQEKLTKLGQSAAAPPERHHGSLRQECSDNYLFAKSSEATNHTQTPTLLLKELLVACRS